VTAPASDNQNLRAQRWVGLVYRQFGGTLDTSLGHRSYDELADDSFGLDPIFWKLTLPVDEAPELIRLLATLDVDASTVYPGFYGAANAVREMSRWPSQSAWKQTKIKERYWARHEMKLFVPDTE
jgi:hypothetical protein